MLMPSRIDLLIFPSSPFIGFINRQVGLARKSSLWSFIVMKACAFPRQLILSSNSSFSAISFASKLISCSIISDAFLQVFVILFYRNFWWSSGFSSYTLVLLSAKTSMFGDSLTFFISSFNFRWNLSFIFLNSNLFITFIKSSPKLSRSAHCGGHFLVMNP